ncbi:MAG: Gfo/Idh/MocA family oxidoreductase [Bacteroidota bacterium]
MTSRRKFLQSAAQTGLGMATGLILPAPLLAQKLKVAPSDQLRFGVIGCKGMGFSNARSLLKIPATRCVALCDVDQQVLDQRSKDLMEMGQDKPLIYGDYRKMLENKELDFVVIGTPDHWHCLQMVDALEADKHVYVEKPLANSIQECDIMLRAEQYHKKTVQVGMWQRSGQHWQEAMAFVHAGHLGKIRTVKTWAYQGWMNPVPIHSNEAAPKGVNYDLWLGPAPQKPFNKNRFHFNFRWFWDYAGGLMTDWGVHIIDFALYGMKASYPKSVMASGGKFAYPNDASETPDTLTAVYEFDDFTMIWEHATGIDLGPYGRNHGVAFIGNKGTLVVDRQGWEVMAEEDWNEEEKRQVPKMAVPEKKERAGSDLDQHTLNFVDGMKTGQRPNSSVDIAHLTAVVAHMGNIAFKTGRKVYWDQAKSMFIDDQMANNLCKVTYRQPWNLPKY